MRLVLLSSLVLSSCIVLTAPGTNPETPGKAYCTKNSASGACNCSTSDPGLNADTDYVDNCDSTPSGSQCCYDINGDGESTFCNCAQAQCATDTDTGNCSCQYFDYYLVGNVRDNETPITTCTNATCCASDDSCSCYNATNIICSDRKVDSCTASSLPNPRKCGGGQKVATSCSGLKWKK